MLNMGYMHIYGQLSANKLALINQMLYYINAELNHAKVWYCTVYSNKEEL